MYKESILGCNSVLVFSFLLAFVNTSWAATQFFGPSEYLCFDATATSGCAGNDSPFTQDQPPTFFLEDFEDGMLDTPGVSASRGRVTPAGGEFTDSVDADDGVIDGFGNNGRSVIVGSSPFSSSPISITYSFDESELGTLPTHVGIVWTDSTLSVLGTFEAFDRLGASLGTIEAVPLGDNTPRGTTQDDRFFGIINDAGISAITMSQNRSDMEVDHLQYGVVPVPAAVSFLVSGLVWMMGFSCLNKKVA